jgi:hypothetical protein
VKEFDSLLGGHVFDHVEVVIFRHFFGKLFEVRRWEILHEMSVSNKSRILWHIETKDGWCTCAGVLHKRQPRVAGGLLERSLHLGNVRKNRIDG